MRARPILLLILAVLLAGGTALLARSWLAAQRAKEVAQVTKVPPPAPIRGVLVARLDIRRGEILRPDQLAWQNWPVGDLNKNYIVRGGAQTPQSFGGWVVINPISSGEPITLAKIIKPGDRGFLAAVLQPGMRAVSVSVSVTSGISGFIFPGDRVDVLLTYPVPQQPGSRTPYQHKVTETALRNVRVLAIDQRLQSKPGEAVIAHTVTFEVTPRQAEAIAVAQDLPGVKFSLSLRPLVAAAANEKFAAEPANSALLVHKIAATTADPPTVKAADPAGKAAADSSIAQHASYTFDSDISPLLPKVKGGDSESATATVTILRGATITSQATTPTNAEGASRPPAKSAEGK
jgi:pilus assembly protein CpaB